MGTMVTPTSTLSSRRLETLTEESAVGTLILMPMESSNRFSTLLTEQDSVLPTLVCPLLLSMTELLPPSTQSLLLPLPSTQCSQLLQLTLLRLLKPRLLILLLLLPLLLLRGGGVRLLSPTDLELLTPLMPTAMLVFLMLLVFLTLLVFLMLVWDMLVWDMAFLTMVKLIII